MNKTFTTSRGVTVEFIGIAPLLDKLEAQRLKTLPKPPTYTPPTAAGFVPQPIPHHHYKIKVSEKNEEGIEQEIEKWDSTLETDEDRANWNAYQDQLKAAQAAYTKTFARTVLLRGVKVDRPASDDWIKEQEFMGYEVPEDPFERHYYWLETEVVTTKEELEQIVMGVLAASGVSEEVISDMEESFRSELGRSTAERTNEADTADATNMDDESTVRASGNGHESATVAIGV